MNRGHQRGGADSGLPLVHLDRARLMNDPMAVLNALLVPLTAMVGVMSCKVGLEANLTPDDYPIIRIVPSNLTPNGSGTVHGSRTLAITVYFGAQLLEATDGLPAVYAELFRLDADIRGALQVTATETSRATGGSLQVTYRDTVLDEDRLPHYKLMSARFDVGGVVRG